MRRRHFLTVAAVGGVGASLGGPAFLRRAAAATPIKIGMPAALSGGYAQYGIQAKRAAELYKKAVARNIPIRQVLEEEKVLPREEIDRILDLHALAHGGRATRR